MEYQYNHCENNHEYTGSSIHQSDNLTQLPINSCGDRSRLVFQNNSVGMSNGAEVQLSANSNLYEVSESQADVGASAKISFSNQRILEDLSHSKPLYVTRANDLNLQKSIHVSNANLPQTLSTDHQGPPLVSPVDGQRQTMQTLAGGACLPENNSTSIHISFSENYLHEEREQDRSQPRQLDLNEMSHCSYGNVTPKIGSR